LRPEKPPPPKGEKATALIKSSAELQVLKSATQDNLTAGPLYQ
jgi:hypothetical protein